MVVFLLLGTMATPVEFWPSLVRFMPIESWPTLLPQGSGGPGSDSRDQRAARRASRGAPAQRSAQPATDRPELTTALVVYLIRLTKGQLSR